MDAKELLRRADKARNRQDQWRPVLEDIYRYFLPARNNFNSRGGHSTKGHAREAEVFDSTGVHGLHRLANRLHGGMFPTGSMWTDFQPVPLGDNEEADHQIRKGLHKYRMAFFNALWQTNFSTAISELCHDYGIGTGVLAVQDGGVEAPAVFKAVSPALVAFENEPNGAPRNVYRYLRVRCGSIERIWGSDVTLSSAMRKKIKKTPEEEVDAVEVTMEVDGKTMFYVITEEDGTLILEKPLPQNPWLIARFSVVADEEMGRGPAFNALGHVRVVNRAMELFLRQGSLSINPPLTYVQSALYGGGSLKLSPGKAIPVLSNNGVMGKTVEALDFGGRYDVSQITLDELRMQINKMMGDTAVPSDNHKPRTATEIHERVRELATNNAAIFGRANTEIFRPLVLKIVKIFEDRGILPKDIGIDDPERIQIVPVSPVARADRAEEVNNVVNALEIQETLGTTSIDKDAAVSHIALELGVPPNLVFSKEQRDAARDAQVAAQQQQLQQQGGQPNVNG